MSGARLTFGKTSLGVMLVRIAAVEEDGPESLYTRLMEAWLHRTSRRLAALDVSAAELALLHEHVGGDLTACGVTVERR